MKNEIERKFLVKKMPIDIQKRAPRKYERYYLEVSSDFEDRIQKVDEKYYREKKKMISELERTKEKEEITQEEFEHLKIDCEEGIVREGYEVSSNPNITIKVYKGRFEPLIRAEVEFKTAEEAESFKSLDWMSREITNSALGRDSKLIQLSDSEFRKLLSAQMGE